MNELPNLPDGYFFRIREGWFFGPTVEVQLRRRWKLGPLKWSTRVEKNWSTQEILNDDRDRKKRPRIVDDREVALVLARHQAADLRSRLRRVDLGDLEGDHP